MNQTDRIYVAGNETIVGKALLRRLDSAGYSNVVDTSSVEPDLTDGASVNAYFEAVRPDYVFLAAGKSGGIGANQKYPADLMLNNLLIQCQIIRSAQRHGARKLLYVASSCSYPRSCPQPMQVRSLMTGPLESTSEAYAMAKIDGAQTVEVWGSGSPRREFIFVDDVADAALFLMQSYSDPTPVNLGNGSEISIKHIAELIRKVVGYNGQLRFDPTKPDGMPLKALDSSELMAMGWRPKVSLQRGLEETYRWFLDTTQDDV